VSRLKWGPFQPRVFGRQGTRRVPRRLFVSVRTGEAGPLPAVPRPCGLVSSQLFRFAQNSPSSCHAWSPSAASEELVTGMAGGREAIATAVPRPCGLVSSQLFRFAQNSPSSCHAWSPSAASEELVTGMAGGREAVADPIKQSEPS